jgi:pimeloyl-ACP methyl ester carboxylesterase
MPTPRRRFRRVRRMGRSIITIYLLVCLAMFFLQTKLSFPGASTQGAPDAVVDPPPGCELLHLTAADGVPIAALFGKAMLPNGRIDPRAASLPTLLYFYGNGMCLADSLAEFNLFRGLGCNCIAVEYEGYGMSGGKPSESGCYAAAEAAYHYLLSRTDIDTHRLIPAGWSLGGAVAIDLAHKHRTEGPIVALMTFSAFTSMADVARYHYPIVPASLLLIHRFESLAKLRDLTLPHFLGHGRHDAIVPFACADRLAEVRAGPLTRFTSDSDHNDFFDVSAKELTAALARFLQPFQPPAEESR